MPFRVIKFCKHSPGALTPSSFSRLSPSAPLATPSTSQLLCLPLCALYSEGPSDICIPSRFSFFFFPPWLCFPVPLALLRFLYFCLQRHQPRLTCCTARANSVKVNRRTGTNIIRKSTQRPLYQAHFASTGLLIVKYSAAFVLSIVSY